MKTFFHSVFAARIQGKPVPPLAAALRAALPAFALVATAFLALPCRPAAADGMDGPSRYGPPPELPPGSQSGDDTPRKDIHMGTVDHMRMGRDEEGNEIMEIRPRPKPDQNQPQAGPFYIYPQVGLPGAMPMGAGQGMGQPGTGQGGYGTGNMAPGGQYGQGAGQARQGLPAGGQSGQGGQAGPSGQAGQGGMSRQGSLPQGQGGAGQAGFGQQTGAQPGTGSQTP
ncbi:hypothetical protein [Solidesulfovibrio alcoholivorans]|uniref:hypothetical protein n=1 Tax=Solidesulfovibrio alcoholivorans TaxID=81406 RepID=UPI000A757E93|nr:hypothetical protein [Solidesulfovibrio alcoholivorans]